MWCVQANRWLSLRLELLGDGVVFATAILASIFLQANAGLAGLAMTSALNMCGFLNWMVRSVSEMEVRHAVCMNDTSTWVVSLHACNELRAFISMLNMCSICLWIIQLPCVMKVCLHLLTNNVWYGHHKPDSVPCDLHFSTTSCTYSLFSATGSTL